MTARKARTTATKQVRDGGNRCPAPQQLFSDPFVRNAPIGIGARESLWNPQPLQPSLVNGGGLGGRAGPGNHPLTGAWLGAVKALEAGRIWGCAASTTAAPLVAKPTCACNSRTQGAYPLFWRRRGFWLVNPTSRPR
jgi:hypothetical protein